MILTYKRIDQSKAVTMTVVPDGQTWFLKGYTDDNRDLVFDLVVEDETIDTILVATGSIRDALFADIPEADDSEALEADWEDAPEAGLDYETSFRKIYAALEKQAERKRLIFTTILSKVVQKMKEGSVLDLDRIIPIHIGILSQELAAKNR